MVRLVFTILIFQKIYLDIKNIFETFVYLFNNRKLRMSEKSENFQTSSCSNSESCSDSSSSGSDSDSDSGSDSNIGNTQTTSSDTL